MWLTPPHMKRKMTDFTLGGKCGPYRGSFSLPSAAHMAPRAAPKKPPPARNRKSRRLVNRVEESVCVGMRRLPYVDEFIQVEEQPRQAFQLGRIAVQVS